MKHTIFFLSITLLFACNSKKTESEKKKEIPAGGPCSYKHRIYPATVIKIVGKDTNRLDILFEVPRIAGTKDTLYYYRETHNFLTRQELRANDIKAGNIYQYVEIQLVEGACTPHDFTLKLVKYDSAQISGWIDGHH